jgi:hypothetical protein
MEQNKIKVSEQTGETALVPWKFYLTITLESLLMFYLATFCVAMYFTHQGVNSIILSIFLVALYLFVIFGCAQRVIKKLPVAALMLFIPLAPLIAIIILLSLVPVLQYL